MPVPFNVMQDEHGSGLWWEQTHGPFEVHSQVVASLRRAAAEYRSVVGGFDTGFPSVPGARVLEHNVDGHPVEPSSELAVAAERPDALPTPDEHVLREFPCLGRVAGHAEAQRVDPVDVTSIQGRERRDLPLLHPANQLQGVIGRVRHRGFRAGSRLRAHGQSHPFIRRGESPNRLNVGCQPADGPISYMDECPCPLSLARDSLTMPPIRFLLVGPLGLLFACGDSASTGTVTSPPRRDDTPFEYSLLFTPSDPTYGTGGMVRGVGAIWRWSTSGAFVLELPVAPVAGIPFGGTQLVLALTRYPAGPGNLPGPGQYDIGPDTPEFNGRAWLRDPSRTWYTDIPGFLVIREWLPDGRVDGILALRFIRDERDAAGQLHFFESTVSGSVIAAEVVP
jgi:hypothetical protein